ncbi:phosphotransferase [Streptomyces sp. NPDC097619]|uniref:phosphotransferase family protein n=1 Tax=Streptomyces sp. NPDC097619 TaxID=3157228 RepID=UPI00333490BF
MVTALMGRPLHGLPFEPTAEARLQQALGSLIAALHHSAPPRRTDHQVSDAHIAATVTATTTAHSPEPAAAAIEAKLERHLTTARPHLHTADEALVRALARQYASLPAAPLVPTHGDLQYRNLLVAPCGAPRLFDFERSEYATATRDLVRLSDTWAGRPELRAAFLDGYGRELTPTEELRLRCETAFDSVSGIAYGTTHQDPEVTERAHRSLARLHAG